MSYEAELIKPHSDITQQHAALRSATPFDRFQGWTIFKVRENPPKYYAILGNRQTSVQLSIEAVKQEIGRLSK
jgi:hypothetical protein